MESVGVKKRSAETKFIIYTAVCFVLALPLLVSLILNKLSY
jgi:hypothetical protein